MVGVPAKPMHSERNTVRHTTDDDAERAIERITDRTAKVVVVGQGYVGLPVAMRAVEVGFTVVGFDASVERVEVAGGRDLVRR